MVSGGSMGVIASVLPTVPNRSPNPNMEGNPIMAEVTSGTALTVIVLDQYEAHALNRVLSMFHDPDRGAFIASELRELAEALGVEL